MNPTFSLISLCIVAVMVLKLSLIESQIQYNKPQTSAFLDLELFYCKNNLKVAGDFCVP